MAATTTAIFLQQPITIESEPQNNGSVVTLTSRTTVPNLTTELMQAAERWCNWIQGKYRREAEAVLENNQVICTLGVQSEHLAEDLMPELIRILETGRSRSATAGADNGDGMVGGGEEDLEIANTT